MQEEDARLFSDFLLRMLKFDPNSRATPRELLSDAWLRGGTLVDDQDDLGLPPLPSVSAATPSPIPIQSHARAWPRVKANDTPESLPSLMSGSLSSTLSPPQVTPLVGHPILLSNAEAFDDKEIDRTQGFKLQSESIMSL